MVLHDTEEEDQGVQQAKSPRLCCQGMADALAEEALQREADAAYDDESEVFLVKVAAQLDDMRQNPMHDPAVALKVEKIMQELRNELRHRAKKGVCYCKAILHDLFSLHLLCAFHSGIVSS